MNSDWGLKNTDTEGRPGRVGLLEGEEFAKIFGLWVCKRLAI